MAVNIATMVDQPRIAVVGAGMGGLTTAIFLQRFGYQVIVYERAPRLERLGAGINISPHVSRLFAHLGMLDRMIEIGVIPQERYTRNGYTGEVTFTVPVGNFADKYGAPHLIMHRGDLQEALVSAIAPGTIELDKCLVNLVDRASGAELTFADGSSVEADIVVAADGINSRIRELLLGPEKPTYTGEVAYRSIYPVERLGDLKLPDHTKWSVDDGTHILVYFITRARDSIYFVTGVPEPDWSSDDFGPRKADREKMLAAFDGFHSDVIRILEAAPESTAWPILERAPLPLWSYGRIALLGDACHPMRPHMGQGAAMAIEDGVMLARCIDHFGGRDAASIFRLYELQRRDRASQVQRNAQGNDWLRYNLGNATLSAEWLYLYDALKVPIIQGEALV
jgi:6-hydroxynicotinate 3-monooxygenase